MNIYIISNTKFGYRNNDPWYFDFMIKYFYNEFIPFVKEKIKPNDIILHLGSVFDKATNLNMLTIDRVQHIFSRLSALCPNLVLMMNKSDATNKQEATIAGLFNNIKMNICTPPFFGDTSFVLNDVKFYSNKTNIEKILKSIQENIIISPQVILDENDIPDDKIMITSVGSEFLLGQKYIRIGSPYQLDSLESEQKGFLIYNTDKKRYMFVKNKTSPKFLKIRLETETSIDELLRDDSLLINNKVDITINSDLTCKKKIEYLLNKCPFNRVSWSDSTKEENIDKEIINVDEMDVDFLLLKQIDGLENASIKESHEEVLKIFKDSYTE